MTILDLWKEAEEKAPECLMDIPYTEFSGYRIAIDMYGYTYPLMMSARIQVANHWNVAESPVDQEKVNSVFYAKFIQKLLPILANGITPIFVFEYGKNPKKKATDEKRTADRELTQERIDSLREDINGDLFASDNAAKIAKLRALEGQLAHFPSSVRDGLRKFLEILGIPVVIGKFGVEAERVASILCIQGIAMAVYSPDGDCLAHGAPMVIRREGPTLMDEGVGSASFSCAHLPTLLDTLDLSMEEFRDVCICSGCDYNKRVFRVGIKKVIQLVRDYGKPCNFPERYDTSCYNYEDCLAEFGEASAMDCIDDDYRLENNINRWEDFSSLKVHPSNDLSEMPAEIGITKSRDIILRHTFDVDEPTNYVYYDVKTITFGGQSYDVQHHRIPVKAVQSEVKRKK